MLLNTIILFGAFQGLIMSILLILKKKKNPAEKVLIFWMLAIVLHLGLTYLLQIQFIGNRVLIIINNSVPFIQAPMIYLYFTTLFLGNVKPKVIIPHFIPAVLALVYPSTGITVTWLTILLGWYVIISVPCYTAWILYSWIGLNREKDSSYNKKSLWLIYPLIGLLIIWISFLVLRFAPGIKVLNLHSYFFIAVTLFVYLISIHLFKIGQDKSFDSIKGQKDAVSSLETALKYSKSGLSDERGEEIENQLARLMEEKKLYLDPDIKLSGLADILNIRINHLSQVINERIGLSFNDYLNKYRIEAFLRENRNPDKLNKTILGLAFDCGFNSKSSFNRVFRKTTGLSPSEYFQKS